MRELGVGGQVQKFDRLRQLQQRRRGEQEIVGQRDDGADRAGVGRVPVGIVVGRLLLQRSLPASSAACPRRRSGRHPRGRSEPACAAAPWKCPNDSANWIASANSASREPCLTCFRNQFMMTCAFPEAAKLSAVPMLYYNIGGREVTRSHERSAPQTVKRCVIDATSRAVRQGAICATSSTANRLRILPD